MKFNKIRQNISKYNKNRGFTLVETIVAVFVLTISLAALLNLISVSLDSFKYSRDEVTANYLIQEAVDSIRNNRDSTVFLNTDQTTGGWTAFLNYYGYNNGTGTGNTCFPGNPGGCIIDPLGEQQNRITVGPSGCNVICPALIFNDNSTNAGAFYSYTSGGLPSGFVRIITMSVATTSVNPTDELDVTVKVSWANNSHSRTLKYSLLNW